MQAKYVKTEIIPQSRTFWEHYEIYGRDNTESVVFIEWTPVVRMTSFFNPNAKPTFLHRGKPITDNDSLCRAIEYAIEKYADYTHCPECGRRNRSVNTALAACPGCGKIYRVKL